MKELSAHTQTLRELAALLHKHGLAELRFARGDVRIRLRREPVENEIVSPEPVASDEVAGATVEAQLGEAVEAPFMGVFSRSARPEEPPLVEAGDFVEEGQVLCLLEANKVFSELPSPLGGVVTRILKENGSITQPGEPLFYIQPSSQGV